MPKDPFRIAVFASGEGSNLGALLARFPPNGDPRVALVVSDREGTGALARAQKAGVAGFALPPREFPLGGAYGRRLVELLTEHRIDLVVLAGYLRKLPAVVVEAYTGRTVNVHPALLPRFGGKGMYGTRVHAAVLAEGERESGASVHFVDAEYDRGPVIAQRRVPVLPDDSPQTLAKRVLAVEHELLPEVVTLIAEGRVRLDEGGRVRWHELREAPSSGF